MNVQGTTYWRWAICAIVGVPTVFLAFTGLGLDVLEAIWSEEDAGHAQVFAGFVAAGLLAWAFLPPARRTIEGGITRAGELQRDWDAGGLTSSPWQGLHLDSLERRTVVAASPRQAARVQRALIRQGAALDVPVVSVPYGLPRDFRLAVAAARRRFTRLVRADRKPLWEIGRRAAYLVDLSWARLTPSEVEEILDDILSWEEVWPGRVAVVFVAEDSTESFPGFQTVRLPSDPLPADVAESIVPEALARGVAPFRGPLLIAATYALCVTIAFVSVGLWGNIDWWSTVSGALSSFGLVIAVCWTLWPPEWARDHRSRAIIVALGLALLMNIGRFFSAIGPPPQVIPAPLLILHLWFALGSTLTVACFILLGLRRARMTRPFPNARVFVWIALLLAAWMTVAADPMLIALGLLGALLATTYGSERARAWVLPLLAVLIAADASLSLLAAIAHDADQDALAVDVRPIITSAIALGATTLLLIRSAAIQRRYPAFWRPRSLLVAAAWLVLWAVAPIPWAVGAPFRAGLTYVSGIAQFTVVASSLLSVLLGVSATAVCRLLRTAPWVTRLGLALPVLAGLVAAATVEEAYWRDWMAFVLMAVVVLAVLPRPVEYEGRERAVGARSIFHSILLIALASFALAVLLPAAWSASIDLIQRAFEGVPLRMIPAPVWVTYTFRPSSPASPRHSRRLSRSWLR